MKTPKKLRTLPLTGTAALLMSTVACGSGEKDAEPEKVTLNIMHPWTSPNVDNEVYKERIAEFEKQHPDIIIKQDGVAATEYKTKRARWSPPTICRISMSYGLVPIWLLW